MWPAVTAFSGAPLSAPSLFLSSRKMLSAQLFELQQMVKLV